MFQRSFIFIACLGWLGCAADDDDLDSLTEARLTIADPAGDSAGSCLALVSNADGGFDLLADDSAHLDPQGQVEHLAACALMPVRLDDGIYWLSGTDLDVELHTPEFDDDPVRHAASTVEDVIVTGSANVIIHPVDESETIWQGTLDVVQIDGNVVTVSVTP